MAAVQKGNVIVGPAARLLMLTYHLDLKDITKITHRRALLKEDVLSYIQQHNLRPKPISESHGISAAPKAASAAAPSATAAPAAPKKAPAPKAAVPAAASRRFTDIPLSNERRQTAEKLLSYKFYVPHAYNRVTVCMDLVVNTVNDSKSTGLQITSSDLILKACAVTLRDVPEANVYYDGEIVKISNNIDVSLYYNGRDGILAPTLRSVDRMGTSHIAQFLQHIKSCIETNNLKDIDFSGAPFGISNFDSPGLKESTEILQHPQTAILSFGEIYDDLDGNLNLVHKSVLTLCYDNRAISDYTAGRFLSALKANIEDDSRMLLGLEIASNPPERLANYAQ